MEYLRLSAAGLIVYTEWLMNDGTILKVDLGMPNYSDYIKRLKEREAKSKQNK